MKESESEGEKFVIALAAVLEHGCTRRGYALAHARTHLVPEVVAARKGALEGAGIWPQIQVFCYLTPHQDIRVGGNEDERAQQPLGHQRLLQVWRHHILDLFIRNTHTQSQSQSHTHTYTHIHTRHQAD
jgi:hypothetical protein